jgi:quercetin dioxygenase-like cupin family protein
MSAGVQPVLIGPGEGMVVGSPIGAPITFKVRGAETGGSMLVFENEVPPGEGPPLHFHENEDEGLYVLDGDFRFRIGDDIRPATPGSFVFVPRGVEHSWQNVGDRTARMLIVFTPSGMERFFESFGALNVERANLESITALGAEVAMGVAGPPLARTHPARDESSAGSQS